MGSSPAFQLYASDFYMDTLTWDCDDVGAYFRLIMFEWVNGPLPKDTAKLAKISLKTRQKFLKNWSKISQKFIENNQGMLINERLEKTREKQREFKERQAESGRKGGLKTQEIARNEPSEPLSSAPSSASSENQAFILQSSSLPSSSPLTPSPSSLKELSAFDNAGPIQRGLISKKGKVLNGAKGEMFERFWDAFNYKRGKAEAIDAFIEIKGFTDDLFIKILEGAQREARARPDIIARNHTPKMAQGWLSSRRWEDEQEVDYRFSDKTKRNIVAGMEWLKEDQNNGT